jgi:hypothetical protein
MTEHSPHSMLLALHQPVDNALIPFYEPMDLECTTESVFTVQWNELQELSAGDNDPIAAVVTFGDAAPAPGLVIMEPALCSAVLAGMWRSDRNRHAQPTVVESEILRQHTADIVGAWSRGWRSEGVQVHPRLAMAASLRTLPMQMPGGTWYAARTVVLNAQDEPVGVLLFCYPEALAPILHTERDRIRWRTRIEHGLSATDRERLRSRVAGPLKHLEIPVRASLSMRVPLSLINNLDRGDVLALDAPVGAPANFSLLDRDVVGQLARVGTNLAIVVRDVPQTAHDPQDSPIATPNLSQQTA